MQRLCCEPSKGSLGAETRADVKWMLTGDGWESSVGRGWPGTTAGTVSTAAPRWHLPLWGMRAERTKAWNTFLGGQFTSVFYLSCFVSTSVRTEPLHQSRKPEAARSCKPGTSQALDLCPLQPQPPKEKSWKCWYTSTSSALSFCHGHWLPCRLLPRTSTKENSSLSITCSPSPPIKSTTNNLEASILWCVYHLASKKMKIPLIFFFYLQSSLARNLESVQETHGKARASGKSPS